MANEKVIITPEGTITGTLSTDENLTTTLSIGPNVSRGLNQEEKLQLATAYEHSQAPHVQYSDIDGAVETYVQNNKETLKGDTGAQGPKGDQGIQGLKGDQGEPGKDGLTTSIKVNGSTYTHSNGTITLPSLSASDHTHSAYATKTDLSSHTNSTTVHVTASEKSAWNNKSTFSGNYNDLTNKPTIPSLNGYATESFVANAISHNASAIATMQTLLDELSAKIAELEAITVLSVIGDENVEEPVVVTLTGITATYAGGDVNVGTNISSLTGITVKANYSDGTSTTVTGYTLSSGTIAEGSNTVTVTYQEKTTTFNVTGVTQITTYTLTINSTPSDAIIKINGTEQKSITVNAGAIVTYEVSKTGYVTKTGSKTVTADETIDITLEELVQYTLTINSTPSDAIVKINNVEQKSITVNAGTTISWSVSKDGYITQNGSKQVTNNETLNITLVEKVELPEGTLQVAQPSDYIVGTWLRPTGVSNENDSYACTDYIRVDYYETLSITAVFKVFSLSPVVWYDADKNYISGESITATTFADIGANNTLECTVPENAVYARFSTYYRPTTIEFISNVTGVIKAQVETFTLLINPTPSDATVKINGVEQNFITVNAGTTVTYEVSKYGYSTQTGTVTVNATETINIVLEETDEITIATIEQYDDFAGFVRNTSGVFSENVSYRSTDYIDISAYSSITVSALTKAVSASMVAWYNADKTFISAESSSTPDSYITATFDVPENAVYARFSDYSKNAEEYNPVVVGLLK